MKNDKTSKAAIDMEVNLRCTERLRDVEACQHERV
jgi:hypothetical protein